jgi:hypothetical protein
MTQNSINFKDFKQHFPGKKKTDYKLQKQAGFVCDTAPMLRAQINHTLCIVSCWQYIILCIYIAVLNWHRLPRGWEYSRSSGPKWVFSLLFYPRVEKEHVSEMLCSIFIFWDNGHVQNVDNAQCRGRHMSQYH